MSNNELKLNNIEQTSEKENDTGFLASAIALAMKTPGVKVDREKFLRKELRGKVPQSVIDSAVKYGTIKAGISKELAQTLAENAINSKCILATSISFFSGIPGGFIGLLGGSAVDVVQYFGNFFNLAQKLMYIYGYKDITELDSSQTDIMIAMLGAASGVEAAQVFVSKKLPQLAEKIAGHLIAKESTKNVFKKISEKVMLVIGKKGVAMFTGQELGEAITKSVPLIGGIISGGLTLTTFKPMAKEINKYLMCNYDYMTP